MKYKNIEIVNIVNFLSDISEKKLPQKISYAIMRNLDSFQKESIYYEKELNKIVESYSTFFINNSDGKPLIASSGVPVVDDDHAKDYAHDLQELVNFEVDVEVYHVDESIFNYEDIRGRYDVLSGKEILKLVNIFCSND